MHDSKAAVEAVSIPSLRDVESQRLGARMLECANSMAATAEIDDFASTGWLPDSFFAALEKLYTSYDEYIAHNIAASELKIMCKVACGRCCHQHVYSTYTFEIINLYRQLRPRSDYADIHRALLANAQEFQTMYAGYLEKAPGREDLAVINTLQHLSALAKPCPLLVANKCSIYVHRPVSCRMYHSLTSPILCTTVLGRTFHLLPPEAVANVLAAVNGRLLFTYSEYLAQGLVVFAAQRSYRPWGVPPGPQ